MKYIKWGIYTCLALCAAAIVIPVFGFGVFMWGHMISDISTRLGLSVTAGNVAAVFGMTAIVILSLFAAWFGISDVKEG